MVSAEWNTTKLTNRRPAIPQLNISKSVNRRRGSLEWPVRSPDLASGFFLWGYVKSMTYKTKPRDIAELRRITDVVSSVTRQMLQKVRRHFYLRCCQDVQETHFEHFLH